MIKLLIIDDEENVRDVYREIFEAHGFEAQTVVDGKDAMDKMASYVPDVILLDFMMPRMDGLDVLKFIKQNPVLKDVIIIVATNINLDREDLEKNWGVSKVLIKVNYNPGQLVEEVKDVIRSSNKILASDLV